MDFYGQQQPKETVNNYLYSNDTQNDAYQNNYNDLLGDAKSGKLQGAALNAAKM